MLRALNASTFPVLSAGMTPFHITTLLIISIETIVIAFGLVAFATAIYSIVRHSIYHLNLVIISVAVFAVNFLMLYTRLVVIVTSLVDLSESFKSWCTLWAELSQRICKMLTFVHACTMPCDVFKSSVAVIERVTTTIFYRLWSSKQARDRSWSGRDVFGARCLYYISYPER